MSEDRVQMTIRLDRADKVFFADRTERAGFEGSVAARAIIELVVQRMKRGGDFIDALHELKTLWRVPATGLEHPYADNDMDDGVTQ